MRVLTDPQGPFERCSQTHHEALPMWASATPPEEMFRYDAACEFEDVVRQRREIEQEAAAARVAGAVDQADQGEGVMA
ncbi:hypothetical protein HNR15_003518 [Allobranchiibius huperziae]|uniref:Uncharacterized protein n=2 Tax=Allobranchiibius huperziae TaxID=1874116 RepID=A0A853DPJ7_9MICO|nr:hypothetical protein [Allobranchiibius huperziae]